MPRIVRRQSLGARVASNLNVFDHFLQLWTDYESFDWDMLNDAIGFPLGVALNILYMFSRALIPTHQDTNDVFATPSGRSASGGFAYLMWVIGYALIALSIGSAWVCYTSRRYYRLFEQNVNVRPPTSSARLVRVDSSPTAYSPWTLLTSVYNTFLSPPQPHPDEHTDVWEISLWSPPALTLQLLTLFSPVHLAVYHLSLPYNPPSYPGLPAPNPLPQYITLFCTQLLISVALRMQQSAYTQQRVDHGVLNKEVLSEYNAKYVHPRLNVIKRDVAVQCDRYNDSVEQFTPDFHRQGFVTRPNPSYASWTSPEKSEQVLRETRTPSHTPVTPNIFSPKIRQPQFDRIRQTGTARSVPGNTKTTSTSMGTENNDLSLSRSIRRTTNHGSFEDTRARPDPSNVGMNGLINWSAQQNRGLSPSKGTTPISKKVRGSTYAESLGTPLGTPRKRFV